MSGPATPVGGQTALRLSGLTVAYARGGAVVDDVSLALPAGRTVAIVGESGSGKSTLLRALLGLNPRTATESWRLLEVRGPTGQPRRIEDARTLRGAGIGIVPQDPSRSLDPLQRIGASFFELHRHLLRITDKAGSRDLALASLDAVGVDDPALRLTQYPHELSGGLLQRILIALALVGDPQLLLADEPTSNLDATVQKRVLDLLDELRVRRCLSLLIVTHDIAVAAQRADLIHVMRGGRLIEGGPAATLLSNPRTEYARQLLGSLPSRLPRKGGAGKGGAGEAGASAPRPIVLEARDLHKAFGRGPARLDAVADVGLRLRRGRTLAVVGESGAGKSTLLRLLVGLERPDRGRILLHGRHDPSTRAGRQAFRRHVQLVYQNPAGSLNGPDNIYVKSGVQRSISPDGAEAEHDANPSGFRFLTPKAGALFINEVGYKRPASADERSLWVRGGFLYNDSPYTIFGTTRTSSNTAFALLADTQLVKTDPLFPERGLYGGVSFLKGDPNVDGTDQYYEGRLYAVGVIPQRPKDFVSLVYTHNKFSDRVYALTQARGIPAVDRINNVTVSYSIHLARGVFLNNGLTYGDHATTTSITRPVLVFASALAVVF